MFCAQPTKLLISSSYPPYAILWWWWICLDMFIIKWMWFSCLLGSESGGSGERQWEIYHHPWWFAYWKFTYIILLKHDFEHIFGACWLFVTDNLLPPSAHPLFMVIIVKPVVGQKCWFERHHSVADVLMNRTWFWWGERKDVFIVSFYRQMIMDSPSTVKNCLFCSLLFDTHESCLCIFVFNPLFI